MSSRKGTSSNCTSRDGRCRPVGGGGVYCLLLRIRRTCRIRLSRFGSSRIGPGWYVYTGSAKRNLGPRLARHLKRRKPFHWHIDYLRAVASLREIWVWPWTPGGECRTHAALSRLPDAASPVRGFGSSDCRCDAHLVSFPSRPAPPHSSALVTYRIQGARLVPGGRVEECPGRLEVRRRSGRVVREDGRLSWNADLPQPPGVEV